MTTTDLPAPPDTRRPRRALGAAAAAGTLPYLALKTAWLTGHPVGLSDPALVAGGSMALLNAITVGLDLCLVALAVTLGSRYPLRASAVVVLLPAWVATGLLAPITLVSFPLTLLFPDTAGTGMEPWVRPTVYGGFAWQGVFLLAAFALLARERWGSGPRPAGPAPELGRVLLGGGAVTGVLGAGLGVAYGALSGSVPLLVQSLVAAAVAVAGIGGAAALVRGTGGPLAVLTAWTGSAVPFADGLWAAVTTMGGSPLSAAGAPAYGLGNLAGLLSGFALAVAALVAVTWPRAG
nr:hypothetical protein [Pseudonocardia sp. AL041005-10]